MPDSNVTRRLYAYCEALENLINEHNEYVDDTDTLNQAYAALTDMYELAGKFRNAIEGTERYEQIASEALAGAPQEGSVAAAQADEGAPEPGPLAGALEAGFLTQRQLNAYATTANATTLRWVDNPDPHNPGLGFVEYPNDGQMLELARSLMAESLENTQVEESEE